MQLIEITATIVSLTATGLMSFGKSDLVKYSLMLWILGSILWFYLGYINHMYGLMAVNVGMVVFEVLALYKWYKVKQ